MKYFAISEELLRAVTNYLVDRPYREVAQAMPALQNLQQIDLPADPLAQQKAEAA